MRLNKELWLGAGCVLLLICLYLSFRIPAGMAYWHPDEIITLEVIEQMSRSGNLDTNWALADLPKHLHYPQYNFSSYILFSAALVRLADFAAGWTGQELDPLKALRVFSAVWHVVTIALVYALGRKHFISRRIALAAASLVALFPLLFQDSLYARPESFATMLVVLLCLLLPPTNQFPSAARFLVSGSLIGFLIACKITFVLIIALPLVHGFLSGGREHPARFFRGCSILGLGLGLGFVLGAPCAILNPSSYVHGIEKLLFYYGDTVKQQPNGLPDGSILERLLFSWSYFRGIGTAFFSLAAVTGLVVLLLQRRYFWLFAVFLCVGTVIYFSVKPVFFARNMSFTIPLLCTSAAVAIAWIAERLPPGGWISSLSCGAITSAVILPFVLFLWTLTTEVLPDRYFRKSREFREELQARFNVPILECGLVLVEPHYKRILTAIPADSPGAIYEFAGVNDPLTRSFRARAAAELNLRKIAELRSPFFDRNLPSCTLLGYHAPNFHYYVPARLVPGG